MSFFSLNVLNVSGLLFLVGAGIFVFAKELKNVLFANKKKFFLYLFINIVAFFIAGLFTLKVFVQGSLIINNLLIQIWILLIGIIHVWAGFSFFKWKEENKNVQFLVFTIIFGLIGSIVFLNTVKYLGIDGLQFFLWTGIVLFVLPFVFMLLAHAVFDIPAPIFERWYFPDQKKMSRPDRDELRNPILISLEIAKQPGGPISRIKAKAPENMTFGRFFYHFVNDYNLHNPEKPIAVKDSSGNNYGWGFYTKKGFLRRWNSIYTEHTITHNRFEENQIVICECYQVKE
jgi:hypothetical protein